MTFANPLGLAWLSLFVPIILLFLLKMKRRPHLVSAAWLWERVASEVQATTPFQRLRSNVQLWLMLLVVALLAFALADLRGPGGGGPGRAVVAIIDASASMGARDGSPTRLDRAVQQLQDLIAVMSPRDRMMVLVAAHGTVTDQVGFTGHAPTLERFARGIRGTDGTAGVREALLVAYTALAQRDAFDRASSEVLVLSDGSNLGLAGLPDPPVPVRLLACGTRCDNVAITGFELRPLGVGARRHAAFVEVANVGATRTVEVVVGTGTDGTPLASRVFELAPGAAVRHTFEIEAAPGLVRATVTPGGDLAADDRALRFLAPPGRVTVAIAGLASPHLVRALATDPDVRVIAHEPGVPCDVLIATGRIPAELPDVPTVLFAPEGELAGLVRGPPVAATQLDGWNRAHPLLRYLELDDIALAGSQTYAAPPGIPFAHAGEAVVAVQLPTRATPLVAFGFALEHSNWPLRVSFPLFVLNVVEVARTRARRDGALELLAGQIAPLEVNAANGRVLVERPDGTTESIVATGPVVYYGGTTRVGRYRAVHAARSTEWVVNLVDRDESMDPPAPRLDIKDVPLAREAASAEDEGADDPLWRVLALLALAASAAEWWAYHRKIA